MHESSPPPEQSTAGHSAQNLTQLEISIDEALVAQIDQLIADGKASSRSDLIQSALERLIVEHQRRELGEQIAQAYRRQPQPEREEIDLMTATRDLIEEEPW